MNVTEICEALRALQRERSVLMKSRIMLSNRLQAIVAGQLGYDSRMGESDRLRLFKEALAHIRAVVTGEVEEKGSVIIAIHHEGIARFIEQEKMMEKPMIQYASELPVAKWVAEPAQRGFGLLSLAVVVGEAGGLSGYSTVGKLWKRFGCAPHSFDGETKMGATWKAGKEGKLPGEEWEKFGYSPRRRSIAYVVGENLVKQNKNEYRKRYDEAKAAAALKYPDWAKLRCHRHAMLLATKRLLRNLWCQWNHKPIHESRHDTESRFVGAA